MPWDALKSPGRHNGGGVQVWKYHHHATILLFICRLAFKGAANAALKSRHGPSDADLNGAEGKYPFLSFAGVRIGTYWLHRDARGRFVKYLDREVTS